MFDDHHPRQFVRGIRPNALRPALIAAVLLGGLSWTQAAAADAPDFSAGPLTIAPEKIRSWVDEHGEVTDQRNVQAMLSQTDITVEEDGSRRVRRWSISKLLTQQAIRDGIRFEAAWSPANTDRPTIAARIIQPNGEVIELNGDRAVVQDDRGDSPDVLDDSKRLILLLAGLQPGSILERVETYQHHPNLTGAFVESCWLAGTTPTALVRVVVTAKPGASVRYEVPGWDVEPTVKRPSQQGDGWQKVMFEVESAESLFDHWQLSSGPDLAPAPMVRIGIPGRWKEMAKAYEALVQPVIADSQETAQLLTAGIDRDCSADERIRKCLQRLRQTVVYTGVEFGIHRIVPYGAETVVSRGFGDCKDQATLLHTMLQQVGVASRLALLRTGSGTDVSEPIPAMNSFNHVILRVDRGDDFVWIDPTADMFPPGLLPPQCSGRRALIIDESTEALIRTPVMKPKDDGFTSKSVIRCDSSGYGFQKQRVIYRNLATIRILADAPDDPRSQAFDDFIASNIITGSEHTSVNYSDADALNLKADATYKPQQFGEHFGHRARIRFDLRSVLADIPVVFISPKDNAAGDSGERGQRKHPVFATAAYGEKRCMEVRFPAFMEVHGRPETVQATAGPITIRLSSDHALESEDGWKSFTVTAEIAVDPSAGPVPAARLEALRERLDRWRGETSPLSGFVTLIDPQPVVLSESGDVAEAVRVLAERHQQYPEDHRTRAMLAQTLHKAKLHVAAEGFIRAAVKAVPEHPLVLEVAETILVSGDGGRVFGSGFDPTDVRDLARRYWKLYPDRYACVNFVRAFQVDQDGYRQTDPSFTDELQKVLLPFLEAPSTDAGIRAFIAGKLLSSLLITRRDEEIVSLIHRMPSLESRAIAPFDWIAVRSLPEGTQQWLSRWSSQTDPPMPEKTLTMLTFSVFLGAHRIDLARSLEEHLRKADRSELIPFAADLLADDVPLPALEEVDRRDPHEVARYGLGQFLAGGENSLYLPAFPASPQSPIQTESPSAWRRLLGSPKFTWTRPAICAFLQRLPISHSEASIGGTRLVFSNPLTTGTAEPDEPRRDSVFVVPWHENGRQRWFFAGDREPLVRWSGRLLEREQWDAAREAVELLASWSGKLPWFNQMAGSAAARVWARLKNSSRKDLELAWAVFALEADARGAANADTVQSIEAAVNQPQYASIQLQLQRALARYYRRQSDIANRYRVLRQMVPNLPKGSGYEFVLVAAAFDSGNERGIKELLDQLAEHQDESYTQFLAVAYDVRRGAWDDALANFDGVSNDFRLRAANTLVWQLLERDAESATLRRAADLLRSALQSDPTPHGYHTLACALIQLGEPVEGLQAMEQDPRAYASNDGDLLYVYGAFCQAIGLDEQAADHFARVLKEDPSCDSASLTRLRMKQLPASDAQ